MIGDWVNIYVFPNENPQKEDLFPARISAIMTPLPSEDSGEHCECQFVAADGGVGYASRPIETCLPIPLTPEILEKNGFKDAQFYSELLWNDAFQIISDCSTLSIRCKNSDLSLNIPCDEVHELQHALKLCGIDKTIEL